MTEISDQLSAALNAIPDPVSGKGLVDSGRAPAPRFADGIASAILEGRLADGETATLDVEGAGDDTHLTLT